VPYKDPARQLEYQRRWITARRRTALDSFGNRCVECGSSSDLQFHHRNPAEKLSHRIWSWSQPRIRAELSKCVLLCAACHLVYTLPLLRAKALAQPRDRYGFVAVPAMADTVVPRMPPGSATTLNGASEEVQPLPRTA
jgi:hypothetical protein